MNNLLWEDQLKQQIPNLRRYARALTQNTASADDLVQDCLERAWDKRENWKDGSNVRAWLFTIMHNIFINGIRRQKIQQEYLSKTIELSIENSEEQLFAMRDLTACLAKLKPEFRETVLLVGLENLSYKETADITGVPIGTVMSRLSRGREELRQLMTRDAKPKLVSIK